MIEHFSPQAVFLHRNRTNNKGGSRGVEIVHSFILFCILKSSIKQPVLLFAANFLNAKIKQQIVHQLI